MSEEYIRPDGRSPKVLRDLNVEVGVLDRAEGSSRVDLGNNIAIATVFGPREMHPKHAARPDKAQMRINYRMATFSVDDYKRPFPSRREKEISKVLSEAFESIILTEKWPRSVIDVHIEIFQSDGGTRTAAAIAISAALADAGIPMRDIAAGIATGIYEDQVCLDLTGHEDMKGTGDMPLVYSPATDEISLFQLDGLFTFEQFKEAFTTSIDSIREISLRIQEAVKEKYLKVRDEYGIDDEDEEIDHSLLEDDDEEEEKTEEFAPPIETSEEDMTEPQESEPEVESYAPVPEPQDMPEEIATSSVDTPVETSSEDVIAETEEVPHLSDDQNDIPETPPTSESEVDMAETSETPVEQESETVEKEMSHRWFNKSGAEIKPMGGTVIEESDDSDDENNNDDDDDEEEETTGIMRDLEYSFDGDE